MLNSVVLISWFCFRNDVDLCHLANADAMKKERKKSLIWGGLLEKKVLEKLHLGEYFYISLVGEILPASLLLILILGKELCFSVLS